MTSAYMNVIEKSENMNIHAEDYIKDGLLHCHKCHTPKQCALDIECLHIHKIVYCLCNCEAVIQRKEDEAFHKSLEKAENNKNRTLGLRDVAFLSQTFANDDGHNPDFINICKKYAENFDAMFKRNIGLFIYGTVGNGKTFGASCIANELLNRGVRVLMTSFPRIKRELSGNLNKNQVLKELASDELLIIDDFGVETGDLEIIYSIINERINSNKPLIITSNIEWSELLKPSSEATRRIFSRIVQACQPVFNDSKGRRYEEYKAKSDIFNQLVGGQNAS